MILSIIIFLKAISLQLNPHFKEPIIWPIEDALVYTKLPRLKLNELVDYHIKLREMENHFGLLENNQLNLDQRTHYDDLIFYKEELERGFKKFYFGQFIGVTSKNKYLKYNKIHPLAAGIKERLEIVYAFMKSRPKLRQEGLMLSKRQGLDVKAQRR